MSAPNLSSINNFPPPTFVPEVNQEKIDLINRHGTLKSAWYEKEYSVRWLRDASFGLGFVFSTIVGAASKYMRARPMTIIWTVRGFSLLAIAAGVIGLACLIRLRKPFWNDPAYRIKQGQQAINTIKEKNYSWPDVKREYGYLMDRYQILEKQDLNILFRQEIANISSYSVFSARHGKDFLPHLDNFNREVLAAKFAQELVDNNGDLILGYKDIKAQYAEELHYLGLNSLLLRDWLMRDLHKLGYEAFKAKHGLDFMNEGEFFTLNEADRYAVQGKFLSKIEHLALDMNTLQSKYGSELKALRIPENGVKIHFLRKQIDMVVTGPLGYKKFREKNPIEDLRLLEPKDFAVLRTPFMDYVSQHEEGLVALQTSCKTECELYKVSSKELARQVLPREVTKVNQADNKLDYMQFRARNGVEALDECNEQELATLKTAFENTLKTTNLGGVLEVQKQFAKDITKFNISQEFLFALILPPEMGLLEANKINYKQFRQRNSSAAIQHLNQSSEAQKLLKEKFLQLPYDDMQGQGYALDRSCLDVKREEIVEVVKRDAELLTYVQFIGKHSLVPLKDTTLFKQLDHLLREKYLNFLAHRSYQDLTKQGESLVCFGLTIKSVLEERWKGLTIQQLAAKYQNDFCDSIREGVFSADEWMSQAYRETSQEKIWTLVNQYGFLFELGILKASVGWPKTIRKRFEAELESVQTFEELLDHQGFSKLIEYSILDTDSKGLQSLIADYYLRHFNDIFSSKRDRFIGKPEEHGLLLPIFSARLNKAHQSYAVAEIDYNRDVQSAERIYSQTMEMTLDAKTKALAAQEITCQQAKLRFNSAERRQEQANSRVESLNNQLSTLPKRLREINEKETRANEKLRVLKSEFEQLLPPMLDTTEQERKLQEEAALKRQAAIDVKNMTVAGEEQARQSMEKVKELENEAIKLEKQISSLRKRARDQEERKTAVQEEITSLEKEITTCRSEAAKLSEEKLKAELKEAQVAQQKAQETYKITLNEFNTANKAYAEIKKTANRIYERTCKTAVETKQETLHDDLLRKNKMQNQAQQDLRNFLQAFIKRA